MDRVENNASYLPVFFGASAVFLWSLGALFCCQLTHIPIFQLCAIIQIIGGIFTVKVEKTALTMKSLIYRLTTGWQFILLLITNQLCYLWAFRLANAAHVDLINYLWPSGVIILETICRKKSLSKKQILGIVLGFLAVVVLGFEQIESCSFGFFEILGYLLAFCACITWSMYTVFGKYVAEKKERPYNVGEDIILVGILNLLCQSWIGNWVSVTVSDIWLLVTLAITSWGLAYLFWQKAIKSDRYTLVGGFANMIPMLSVLWLILGGVSPFTFPVLLACILVTLGCVLLSTSATCKPKTSQA